RLPPADGARGAADRGPDHRGCAQSAQCARRQRSGRGRYQRRRRGDRRGARRCARNARRRDAAADNTAAAASHYTVGKGGNSMTSRRSFVVAAAAAALAAPLAAGVVHAQGAVKVGELNSYKSQPAFLEPYRKGWEMALDEINAKGGVLGRKLEVVSRDDGGNPGDAVRVAEELVSREGASLLTGTFLSHIGLAVTGFSKQKRVFFLAAEPLTDKITWENGNKYTYRLRASTYMQVAMLV